MRRLLLTVLLLSGCDDDACHDPLGDLCERTPGWCLSYTQRKAQLEAIPECPVERGRVATTLGSCDGRPAIADSFGLGGSTTLFRADGSVAGVVLAGDVTVNGCVALSYGAAISCEVVAEEQWCVSSARTCRQRISSVSECYP